MCVSISHHDEAYTFVVAKPLKSLIKIKLCNNICIVFIRDIQFFYSQDQKITVTTVNIGDSSIHSWAVLFPSPLTL